MAATATAISIGGQGQGVGRQRESASKGGLREMYSAHVGKWIPGVNQGPTAHGWQDRSRNSTAQQHTAALPRQGRRRVARLTTVDRSGPTSTRRSGYTVQRGAEEQGRNTLRPAAAETSACPKAGPIRLAETSEREEVEMDSPGGEVVARRGFADTQL